MELPEDHVLWRILVNLRIQLSERVHNIHAYIQMCMPTYMNMYIHTYIHTYTHTHTYTAGWEQT
jgi:hypothetical protein